MRPISIECCRVTEVPWAAGRAADGGRPCLLTPEHFTEVMADACRDSLPRLTPHTDKDGTRWNCFELPSTSETGAPGPAEELLQLQLLSEDGGRGWGHVSVAGTLPRPKVGPDEPGDGDGEFDLGTAVTPGTADPAEPGWVLAGERAEELIGRHFDLMNGLYDEPAEGGWRWEGDVQGMALRPLGRVVERWKAVGDTGEPRLTLIVSLARELPPVLEALSRHPRHVLGRVRTMQPLDRVQELDGTCLRWLSRQPGRRIVEKAGASQRVLAIARVESVDTLENRVLRDLMRRAKLACRRYLAEYGQVSHERVHLVRDLLRQVSRLLHHSAVSGVRALTGVPRPNYVLQHEASYRIVWSAYLRLVRQEKVLDDAWRWRQRVWAEECGLAISAALLDLSRPGSALSSDVLLHSEQVAGRFFDPRGVAAAWDLDARLGGGQADLLDGRPEAGQLACHPLVPGAIAELRPDYVVVRRDGLGVGTLRGTAMVYAVLDFDIGDDNLGRRTESLAAGLRPLHDKKPTRGLIIQPRFDIPGRPDAPDDFVHSGPCRGVRVRLPFQGDLDSLRRHLEWALMC